jgi:hypothetical protein
MPKPTTQACQATHRTFRRRRTMKHPTPISSDPWSRNPACTFPNQPALTCSFSRRRPSLPCAVSATHSPKQNQGLATFLPESRIDRPRRRPLVGNKLHTFHFWGCRLTSLQTLAGTYVIFCFPTVCDREGWSSAGNGRGSFSSRVIAEAGILLAGSFAPFILEIIVNDEFEKKKGSRVLCLKWRPIDSCESLKVRCV